MKILKIIGILLVFLALAAFIAFKFATRTNYIKEPILKNQIQKASINSNGQQRDFLYYAPSVTSAKAILFVLHGSTGDGPGVREQTAYQFDQLAEEKGFVVVYPTGYFNHWNDCRGSADYKANLDNIDDINFLKEVEQYISKTINQAFIYRFATGHSNGGHFCFKLAFEAPAWINGIAPISANIPVDDNLDCTKKGQFVPMFLINGTSDAVNPYDGGLVSILGNDSRGMVLSTDKTINYWTKLGACNETPQLTKVSDINTADKSQIAQYDWSCNGSSKVRLFKVIAGGHTIPSTAHQLPFILGTTNRDVDAPKAIWSFFESLMR